MSVTEHAASHQQLCHCADDDDDDDDIDIHTLISYHSLTLSDSVGIHHN